MPCSGKHVNDARTSAGSAGLGAVAAVRAVRLAQEPLGGIMAIGWRPRVLWTIA